MPQIYLTKTFTLIRATFRNIQYDRHRSTVTAITPNNSIISVPCYSYGLKRYEWGSTGGKGVTRPMRSHPRVLARGPYLNQVLAPLILFMYY